MPNPEQGGQPEPIFSVDVTQDQLLQAANLWMTLRDNAQGFGENIKKRGMQGLLAISAMAELVSLSGGHPAQAQMEGNMQSAEPPAYIYELPRRRKPDEEAAEQSHPRDETTVTPPIENPVANTPTPTPGATFEHHAYFPRVLVDYDPRKAVTPIRVRKTQTPPPSATITPPPTETKKPPTEVSPSPTATEEPTKEPTRQVEVQLTAGTILFNQPDVLAKNSRVKTDQNVTVVGRANGKDGNVAGYLVKHEDGSDDWVLPNMVNATQEEIPEVTLPNIENTLISPDQEYEFSIFKGGIVAQLPQPNDTVYAGDTGERSVMVRSRFPKQTDDAINLGPFIGGTLYDERGEFVSDISLWVFREGDRIFGNVYVYDNNTPSSTTKKFPIGKITPTDNETISLVLHKDRTTVTVKYGDIALPEFRLNRAIAAPSIYAGIMGDTKDSSKNGTKALVNELTISRSPNIDSLSDYTNGAPSRRADLQDEIDYRVEDDGLSQYPESDHMAIPYPLHVADGWENLVPKDDKKHLELAHQYFNPNELTAIGPSLDTGYDMLPKAMLDNARKHGLHLHLGFDAGSLNGTAIKSDLVHSAEVLQAKLQGYNDIATVNLGMVDKNGNLAPMLKTLFGSTSNVIDFYATYFRGPVITIDVDRDTSPSPLVLSRVASLVQELKSRGIDVRGIGISAANSKQDYSDLQSFAQEFGTVDPYDLAFRGPNYITPQEVIENLMNLRPESRGVASFASPDNLKASGFTTRHPNMVGKPLIAVTSQKESRYSNEYREFKRYLDKRNAQ